MSAFSFLRIMDESDLSIVHAIENSAYDFPWSLDGFVKSLDQGLNYVFCSDDSTILGYCCILPVLDEAHILNVCVAPECQGKGIARAALTNILQVLASSDFRTVYLEVRESNLTARKLYQSFGFSEDGLRKGYYRSQVWSEEQNKFIDSKEDAVLMSFALVEED